ncbi:MAG: membrane protein insertion efficiency factor YidD [Candidatus Magasanikbacteria bacterium RIFOXYD2_FULL_41_14]|uniref:Putative membrane protein insertion efficiency factor n=1 Tax=Candidatus Magasanikbacteria bacterium RIFOXYD2_FULL_41_14 TaxID=1798709 RepID=A0A1F6PCD3_9BACT|nr:MAG: membrane protein insertion efficiency factor YidD [Candidatus Magasanikbacteria bacterium RIFOXYD2_FULL_41_14]
MTIQNLKLTRIVLNLFRWPLLFLIRIYQKTISPDHGFFKNLFPHGYCRFYPTCSEYGYQAIKKRGLVVGSFKTIWRILRCNPWNKGGVDEP